MYACISASDFHESNTFHKHFSFHCSLFSFCFFCLFIFYFFFSFFSLFFHFISFQFFFSHFFSFQSNTFHFISFQFSFVYCYLSNFHLTILHEVRQYDDYNMTETIIYFKILLIIYFKTCA